MMSNQGYDIAEGVCPEILLDRLAGLKTELPVKGEDAKHHDVPLMVHEKAPRACLSSAMALQKNNNGAILSPWNGERSSIGLAIAQ